MRFRVAMTAMIRNAIAMISGATNGMSVIAWCARKNQCGIVARTSPQSSPARRPHADATAR